MTWGFLMTVSFDLISFPQLESTGLWSAFFSLSKISSHSQRYFIERSTICSTERDDNEIEHQNQNNIEPKEYTRTE